MWNQGKTNIFYIQKDHIPSEPAGQNLHAVLAVCCATRPVEHCEHIWLPNSGFASPRGQGAHCCEEKQDVCWEKCLFLGLVSQIYICIYIFFFVFFMCGREKETGKKKVSILVSCSLSEKKKEQNKQTNKQRNKQTNKETNKETYIAFVCRIWWIVHSCITRFTDTLSSCSCRHSRHCWLTTCWNRCINLWVCWTNRFHGFHWERWSFNICFCC